MLLLMSLVISILPRILPDDLEVCLTILALLVLFLDYGPLTANFGSLWSTPLWTYKL